ncbi:MAG: hypothetical protein FWG77_05230 [Treponema sp.]|nr:hypothetical protein [Treponema sp.]
MTIREAAAFLSADILHEDFEDAPFKGAYSGDLLSDVLSRAKNGNALITIQAHLNTVAVAATNGLPLIIICNSRPVPPDMLAAAKEHGIALLHTNENQFTVSGRLYSIITH